MKVIQIPVERFNAVVNVVRTLPISFVHAEAILFPLVGLQLVAVDVPDAPPPADGKKLPYSDGGTALLGATEPPVDAN